MSAPARKPRLSHPLSGADPATFLSVLSEGGGVSANRIPQLACAAGAVVGRLPLMLAERLVVAARRRPIDAAGPPIIIVGHWRSGTTHLYNLLGRAGYGFVPPIAAGLPWDFLTLGALLGPALDRLLPETRYIDNIPVKPDSPQEDEIGLANMSPLSFYHALYFPKRFRHFFDRGLFLEGATPAQVEAWQRRFLHLLTKLAIQQPGRRLVIKNPVYTGRVALLHRLLPEARFIHIHRDPTDVFFSMRNFYEKLLEEFALQRFDHLDIEELVLETYPRLMDRLEQDRASLPPGCFVEMRYDRLIADPLGSLERLYQELGLPDFAEHRPHFEAHLASVRDYRKNRLARDTATVAKVEARWRSYYERYDYPLTTFGLPEQRSGTA